MRKFKPLLRGLGYWLGSLAVFTAFIDASPRVAIPLAWQEIKPGGESICARGGEFSFFVSRGRSDKVVIDFIGGGACWNALTCGKGTATFTDSVDELRRRYEEGPQGIYDRGNPANPLKEWTHVVIPYCTGDIHWGNHSVAYTSPSGRPFTIHHKGAVNTKTVLRWVGEHYGQAQRVLVTGCSAGAYGSIYWTPALRRLFPRSDMLQIADSGAGVVTQEFFRTSFPLWNASKEAPRWIPELDPDRVDWSTLTMVDLYRIVGTYYPEVPLGQYNTAFDVTQTFFYEIMGGNPDLWSQKMHSSISKIADDVSSFRSYTAPGEEHCILPYQRFYNQKSSGGVKFRDWFAGYIDGTAPPSVECEQCEQPR